VSEAVDHERPRDCALGPVGGVIGFSLGAGHMLSAPGMVRDLGIGGDAAGLRLGDGRLGEVATAEALLAGTFASLIAVLIGWNANVATGAARPPVAAGTGSIQKLHVVRARRSECPASEHQGPHPVSHRASPGSPETRQEYTSVDEELTKLQ